MSSSTVYTLHYYDGRGRAEIIRLIFVQAGQKFEDIRYDVDQWAKVKNQMPLGHIPVLEFNGEKLPQSIAIARYIARQFKLTGKDELESTKCDIIVDTMQEAKEEFYRIWFLIKDEKVKETEQIKFKTDIIPEKLKGLEKLMNTYGNGTWAVGNNVTWADLFIYDAVETLLNADDQILEKYPALQKNREAVAKLPNIAEYLTNRKETRL